MNTMWLLLAIKIVYALITVHVYSEGCPCVANFASANFLCLGQSIVK